MLKPCSSDLLRLKLKCHSVHFCPSKLNSHFFSSSWPHWCRRGWTEEKWRVLEDFWPLRDQIPYVVHFLQLHLWQSGLQWGRIQHSRRPIRWWRRAWRKPVTNRSGHSQRCHKRAVCSLSINCLLINYWPFGKCNMTSLRLFHGWVDWF